MSLDESTDFNLDLINEAVMMVDPTGRILFQNLPSKKHFGDVVGKEYNILFGSNDLFIDSVGAVWSISSYFDKNKFCDVKILKKANKIDIESLVEKEKPESVNDFFEESLKNPAVYSVASTSTRHFETDCDLNRLFRRVFEEQFIGAAIFSVDRTCDKIIPLAKNLSFELNRLARLPIVEGIAIERPISKTDHQYLQALKRVARTGRQEKIVLSEEAYHEEVWIKPISSRELVSIHREITAEINGQTELATARRIIDTVDQAVISTDNRGVIILINRAAEKLFGRKRDQILGRDAFSFMEVRVNRSEDRLTADCSRSDKRSLIITRSDGSRVEVEALVTRIEGSQPEGAGGRVVYSFVKSSFEHVLPESTEKTIKSLIETLSTVVEVRDPYTAGHQRRVSKLATAIATEMGLNPDQIDTVREGALLHDIGKISVPTEILSKPGRLTENEWFLIQSHSEAGFKMLERIDLPWPVSSIVRQHHERLDGSGYPQGLRGKEIPFETRIVTVADVFEAIVSHRPYRPAHETSAAIIELTEGAGRLYDPDVVDCCLSVVGSGFSLD
ncbi:MAG: HD domain-containing protein [Kosmotogaceae bacterium]|nr:HD domain-containing protein [Kosmotogaceae bacterium]